MKTSEAGRKLIEQREGVRLTAYKDGAGVWTIGVGHTTAAGAPKVTPGMRITAAQASEILARDLADVERAITSLVSVTLNQNEFDALGSLVFNIGKGHFSGSTILQKLNAGDRLGAAAHFSDWDKITVNGKKVVAKGLQDRREAERKQFLTPPVNPTLSPASVAQTSTGGFWAQLFGAILGKVK